jgi:hypothetical protein
MEKKVREEIWREMGAKNRSKKKMQRSSNSTVLQLIVNHHISDLYT